VKVARPVGAGGAQEGVLLKVTYARRRRADKAVRAGGATIR